MVRKKKIEKDIMDNIRWFSRLSLEKRFKIAFDQIKAIKILRGMTLKKNAAAG